MNSYDVDKFLSQNLKCFKSQQILNNIKYKYGYAYMVGALSGGKPKKNPIPTTITNLYDLITYKPELITENNNLDDEAIYQLILSNETTIPDRSYNYLTDFINNDFTTHFPIKIAGQNRNIHNSYICLNFNRSNINWDIITSFNLKFKANSQSDDNTDLITETNKVTNKWSWKTQEGYLGLINLGNMISKNETTTMNGDSFVYGWSAPIRPILNEQDNYYYLFHFEINELILYVSEIMFYYNGIDENNITVLQTKNSRTLLFNSVNATNKITRDFLGYIEIIYNANSTIGDGANITVQTLNLSKHPTILKNLKEPLQNITLKNKIQN